MKLPLSNPPLIKNIDTHTKANIGINLAIVTVIVKILDDFNPVLLIIDNNVTRAILINVFIPSKLGNAIIKSLAKPAAIADQAIMVTNHPNNPTINPTKSPNADLEYWKAPPFLSK